MKGIDMKVESSELFNAISYSKIKIAESQEEARELLMKSAAKCGASVLEEKSLSDGSILITLALDNCRG